MTAWTGMPDDNLVSMPEVVPEVVVIPDSPSAREVPVSRELPERMVGVEGDTAWQWDARQWR